MGNMAMKRTTLIAATSASLVALGIAAAAFGHGGGGPRAGAEACPAGHEEHCGAAGRSGQGTGGHGMSGHGMGSHGMGSHGMGSHGMGSHGMGGHGMGGHGMRGQGMGGHGGGGHGMRGGMSLAGLDTVKAELKLTAEQQPEFEKYADLVKTQAEARQRMHEGMHSGSADHHAMHDTMRAYNRQAAIELSAVRKALFDVLTPEQRAIADRNLGNSSMAMGGGRGRHH